MTDLLLDEPFGVAELDQMGHVGMAQAVQAQVLIEADLGSELGESFVEVAQRHPGQPLGDPQRGMVGDVVQRPRRLTHWRKPATAQSTSGTANTVRRRGIPPRTALP